MINQWINAKIIYFFIDWFIHLMNCVFCQIARRTLPTDFIYDDNNVMVFPDIHPVKPVHLLIVPKKHMVDFMDVQDTEIWDKIREVAQKMITQFNLADKGYRLSINGGGAQIIDHFHMHLLGPM